MNTQKLDNEYIANTYNRAPLVLESGRGSVLTDENGKTYIDLGSGIAVNGFGVCDDQWVAAVTAQLGKLPHGSNLYYTEPQVKLAEMLCQRTGMKKVFFGNSGAEANECAIKCARKYSHDKYGAGRHVIITLKNSFHGRTMATLSATGQDSLHQFFDPFLEGFVYAPANDVSALRTLCGSDVCAVMIELVQGEGGVIALDRDYVSAVAELCAERDILLIVDEVQTGNGRTGTLYAFMQYGVLPDIVTTAKGLAGGLPLGCCMMGEKVRDTLTPGTHGSTFGGNPVCAAGAVSILSRIDDKLLEGVRERARYIREQLTGARGVKAVTGLGLMIGIETERSAGDVLNGCREAGVIVLNAHDRVRLLPALNIPQTELEKAIDILKEVIAG